MPFTSNLANAVLKMCPCCNLYGIVLPREHSAFACDRFEARLQVLPHPLKTDPTLRASMSNRRPTVTYGE